MPLKSYVMLKGRAVDMRFGSGANPHYQVRIVDNQLEYRIAVNIQSSDGSEVQYLVRSNFQNPLRDAMDEHPMGRHVVPSRPGGLALDYIRGNLAEPREFVALPRSAPGPDNDLNEKLDSLVQRAMADEDAMVYAFGESWGPEAGTRDKIFGFLPGNGIHDIHMNQGNPPGRFASQNGPWQDGGLIFQFPQHNQWSAIFLKFQTQAWHSDDSTGDPPPGGPGDIPSDPPPTRPDDPGHVPNPDQPDGMIRIVAALVNDIRSPEQETVTLLNTMNRDISLAGWKLADRNKNKMPLAGIIRAGETLRVRVQKPAELSNKGGLISVLDGRGLKVDGVAYTKEQVRQPGMTLKF